MSGPFFLPSQRFSVPLYIPSTAMYNGAMYARRGGHPL